MGRACGMHDISEMLTEFWLENWNKWDTIKMEHKIRWKDVDWIHLAQDRNQQRNELWGSTKYLTSWETISLSRRTAPCGVIIFRKMKAHLSKIQQSGAYYTKTYGECRYVQYNTTHSYPRAGIEENGLALWPERRLLNGMGGHQSRSADGIRRQPNGSVAAGRTVLIPAANASAWLIVCLQGERGPGLSSM